MAKFNPNPYTLYVHDHQVDCHGFIPQKCFKVKRSLEEPWSLDYDGIEGFVWQPGIIYKLSVRDKWIGEHMDAGSYVTELVKILATKQC